MKKENRTLQLCLRVLSDLFIILIVLICILPIAWVFLSSLKTNTDIISGSLGFPGGIKFSNYRKAFQIAPIGSFFVNSLLIAVVGTALNVFVMGMSAYAVTRFEFRGKNAFKLL